MSAYLELMKRAVTGLLYDECYYLPEPWQEPKSEPGWRHLPKSSLLKRRDFSVGSEAEHMRIEGQDWPLFAQSMVGLARLTNLEECIKKLYWDQIPGDFIECGVWRGGVGLFMKAIMNENYDNKRNVWLCDSFEGLPEYDGRYLRDEAAPDHTFERMRVTAQEVIQNFQRYGLADGRVKLVEGWFKDTLPTIDEPMALVRLDGDLYASTKDGLDNLYDQLAVGGFLIIDDYALGRCRDAVDDFRRERGIATPIQTIDWTGVYWRKEAE